MKVQAHLVVGRGYGLAILASQWISQVQDHCDEHNEEHFGEGWQGQIRDRAVVTVEFEVPDTVFDPPPVPVVKANIVEPKQ